MASLVLFTSFFLVICMHSSNARLLPAMVKHSSTKSHHHSISLQGAEKINGGDHEMGVRPPTTPISTAKFGGSLTGNEQNGKKIHGVIKDEGVVDLIPHTKSFVSLSSHNEHIGSDIVESSSSYHVALLKGKHVEDSKKPTVNRYKPGKEDVNHSENNEIVVTDYQPPHRKAPIHNK